MQIRITEITTFSVKREARDLFGRMAYGEKSATKTAWIPSGLIMLSGALVLFRLS